MSTDVVVSTDKSRLDIEFIKRFLRKESHWAAERSPEAVRRSIENSLCFGAYAGDVQVGFARVVTDYSTFSWLCDVFTSPESRGLGVGKLLVDAVVSHESLKGTLMLLATRDAHGLYSRYGGFSGIEKVERFMQRRL